MKLLAGKVWGFHFANQLPKSMPTKELKKKALKKLKLWRKSNDVLKIRVRK